MSYCFTEKFIKKGLLKTKIKIESSADINSGKRLRIIFSGLLILVIFLLILDIFLGSVSIKASEVIKAFFSGDTQ